jgi:PKD domain
MNSLSGSLSVIGSSPPSVTSFAALPAAIDVGQSTELALTYQGGAGPSTISYSGLPAGCASANATTLDCLPIAGGTYTIQAQVTDALGATANATTVLVVNGPVSITLKFLSPNTFPQVDPGTPIHFTGNLTGGTSPYTVVFSWPGGGHTFSLNSTGPFGWTFSERNVGPFTLTATVDDATGFVAESTWSVNVNPAPSVQLAANPSSVDVGQSATLSSVASGGTGTGSVTWYFGDGNSAIGSPVTHSWAAAGNYTINASYADSLGVQANATLGITVYPAISGEFHDTLVGANAGAGTTYQFNASLTGGLAPYSAVWNFGDGTQGTGLDPTHAYAKPGNYTVTVVVSDHNGASLNGTLQVGVGSGPSSSSSSGSSSSFYSGVFLGLVVGAAVAAALVLFAVPRKKKEQPPPPPAPFVAPETKPMEWQET